MAESVVTMCQAIKGGVCPEGIFSFFLQNQELCGYAGDISLVIGELDKPHADLQLHAHGLSIKNTWGSLDAPNGNGEIEEKPIDARGFSEERFGEYEEPNEYGVPDGGNGYSYCHINKARQFQRYLVLK